FWRGTTRERDAEGTLLSNRFLGCLQEFRSGRLRNSIGIRQNSQFTICCCSLSCHRLNVPPRLSDSAPPEPHSAQTTDGLPRSFATRGHPAQAIRRILLAPNFPPHSSEN